MVKEQFRDEFFYPRKSFSYPSDVAPNLIIPNRRTPGSMRKYYQATLIAIALVSVISLLFYRHEYNKLRYVLEVINFFGKPGSKTSDPNCLGENHDSDKLDLRFDVPLPSWQRLNNDLFVYSVYRANQNEIRAIAFGKTKTGNLNMNCKVFFEGSKSTVGKFKYTKISNSSIIPHGQNAEYNGYQLLCQYSEFGIPEGVSFFGKEDGYSGESPVLNLKDSLQSLKSNEMAVCVAPPLNRSISHLDLLSFLNFHQIIGVAHFVVYDNGIPSKFTEVVKDIINSQELNFTFTIVPWNFPFNGISSDIVTRIVEADCLHRMYNKVEYGAVLHWEEYMVPKYHHNMLELLMELEKSMLSSDNYRLDTSVFCTQKRNGEETIEIGPTMLKKFGKFSENDIKNRIIYISKPHKSLNLGIRNARNADTVLINVNRYQYCSDLEKKLTFTDDRSILRFAEYLAEAPIYKQYVLRQNAPTK